LSCCYHDGCEPQIDERYRRVLWAALVVNVTMFLVEIVAGIVAGSVSLRADALDFLSDAANYAIALAVVGLALRWRARAALFKGGVIGLFGLWVAASTTSHAITAAVPRAELMGAIGLLALAANLAVAGLLYRLPRGRQPSHVGLVVHAQRLHRQHRRHGRRGRCVGVGKTVARHRRGRDDCLSRAILGAADNPASAR
jgi:Co/Zn/Cd efflux system component